MLTTESAEQGVGLWEGSVGFHQETINLNITVLPPPQRPAETELWVKNTPLSSSGDQSYPG